MPENKTPVIEVQGLKKYFPTKRGLLHAVDDVTLKIEKGKTLGVVGESGCGKSTLGRTISHLLERTDGKIFLNGEDISDVKGKDLKKVREKMQIIFQDPYSSINPRMSVAEIIAEYMLINHTCSSKAEAFQRTAELMDVVGLARRYASVYPHELDGGRRQRIGIARALSLRPKFIVCDEPVSALDVSIQAQILNLLMDIQDNMGLTYMFITHDLSVVKHISDEIIVMYLGQCVERATSDGLFEKPMHPYTKALLAAIPEPDIAMRNKPIQVIRGEVTSPVNPPEGCRFASRCEHATERCHRETPELVEREKGHWIACHLYDPGNA